MLPSGLGKAIAAIDRITRLNPTPASSISLKLMLQPMLALLLPGAVPAPLPMSPPTLIIHAPHPNPRHHATAAESEPGLAMREAALIFGENGFAAWAGFEGGVGLGFCVAVHGGVAGCVLVAGLARVLRAVAVGTHFEGAGEAGEDAAVLLAVVGLVEDGAAVHADDAGGELFGVPGRSLIILL